MDFGSLLSLFSSPSPSSTSPRLPIRMTIEGYRRGLWNWNKLRLPLSRTENTVK